ncbi:MAG: hypothetical protein JSU04_07440 [Bdellovibrionales bacterium]|nr:hypothetical protein [Bdellovibrionales bacterium]
MRISTSVWLRVFAFSILFLFSFHGSSSTIPFGFWRKHGAEFRSAGAAISQASGASIVLAKPSGVITNDVLYACIWTNDYDTTNSTVTPSGWTLLGSIQSSGNQYITSVYRRIVDGSEAASFTFNFTESANYSMGVIVAYSSPDTNTPEDTTPVFSAGTVSTSSVSMTGLTTVSTATRVVHCTTETSRASTLTAPTGFTQRAANVDTTNAQSIYIFDRLYLNPQATGNLTTTG